MKKLFAAFVLVSLTACSSSNGGRSRIPASVPSHANGSDLQVEHPVLDCATLERNYRNLGTVCSVPGINSDRGVCFKLGMEAVGAGASPAQIVARACRWGTLGEEGMNNPKDSVLGCFEAAAKAWADNPEIADAVESCRKSEGIIWYRTASGAKCIRKKLEEFAAAQQAAQGSY